MHVVMPLNTEFSYLTIPVIKLKDPASASIGTIQ